MKPLLAAGLTLLWLGGQVGSAIAATTYFVSPTGTDISTCGTQIAPCKTITFTLVKTSGGDTVLVNAGNYNECVTVQPGNGVGGVTLVTAAYLNNATIGAATLDGTNQCDGGNGSSLFAVASVVDGSALRGFNVKHGGDSAIWGFGAVDITGNVVTASATSTIGGGIWVQMGNNLTDPNAKATIVNNAVTGNTANLDGGGIYVEASSSGVPSVVEIDSNTITGNMAGAGGGAFGSGITVFSVTAAASDSSTVKITSNTIDGNTASNSADGTHFGYGGGIFVATGSSVGAGTESITVGLKGSGNAVRNNVAEGYGGGISANLQPAPGSNHTIVVEGNTVSANTGKKAAGGIHVYGVELDMTSGTGTIHVQDNTVTGNHATGALADINDRGGGGLFAELYTFRTPTGINDFRIQRNSITGNDSSTLGGGASLLVLASDDPNSDGTTAPTDNTLSFTNNLLATNKALDPATTSARGGGEYVLVEAYGGQAAATVDHDFLTVASNKTDTASGGLEWDAFPGPNSLFTTGATALSLSNSIVVGNDGYGVGGGVMPGPGQAVSISYVDAFANVGADWESQLGVTPGVTPGVISVDPKLDLAYVPPLCSATIDKGDPAVAADAEPKPNGGKVNLGHLGNTPAAIQTFPDLNGDKTVDGIDVLGLAVSFAASAPDPRFNPAADLDFNATVDGLDLSYLTAFFGQTCP